MRPKNPFEAHHIPPRDPNDIKEKIERLTQKVRLGKISVDELRVAALLGDDLATAYLPIKPEETPFVKAIPVYLDAPATELSTHIKEFIKQFPEEQQRAASIRLAVASARQVLPIFEKEVPNNPMPRKAIEAAEEELILQKMDEDLLLDALDHQSHPAISSSYGAISEAYHAATLKIAVPTAILSAVVATIAVNHATLDVDFDKRPEITKNFLEQIQQELLPWVLHKGDPVRKRVEAREKEASAAKAIDAAKEQDQA